MRKTLFTIALVAAALSAAFGVQSVFAARLSVTGCNPNYECYYVGTDGNVYDWNNNPRVTSGVAKSVVGFDGGYGVVWSDSITSPFTLRGGNFSGTVVDDAIAVLSNAMIYQTGSYAKLVPSYGGLWNQTNPIVSFAQYFPDGYGALMGVVFEDGTSNVCDGSDNVELYTTTTNPTSKYVCKKSSGSYVSNVPNFVSPPSGVKEIAGNDDVGVSGDAPLIYVKSDDTLQGINISVPSGKWRNIVMSNSLACGVSLTDSIFKCWDFTGTIVKNSTVPVENPNPTPEPEVVKYADGLRCVTNQIPDLESYELLENGFMNVGGEIARWTEEGKSPYGCTLGGLQCGDARYLVNTSEDGSDQDIVAAFNYGSGTYLDSESFQDPELATAKSRLYPSPYYKPPVLSMGATRNNSAFNANVWFFYGVQNVSEKQPWAYFIQRDTGKAFPMFASGGIASAWLWDGQYYDLVRLTNAVSSPLGTSFIRGTSFKPITSCSIGTNSCTFDFYGTSLRCVGTMDDSGYVGNCGIDENGRCAPLKNGSGVYLPGTLDEDVTIEYDSDGNVKAVWRKGAPVQGNEINAGNIFDCSDIEDGFGGIWPCLKRIGQNVVSMVSSTGEGALDSAEQINSELQKPASVTGSQIELGQREETETSNPAEKMAQGSWNKAFDKEDKYMKQAWMVFAFALAMFMLLALVAFASINKSEG